MNKKVILCLLVLFSFKGMAGTEFTYQGVLNQSGTPANGEYDFEFVLWDNADGTGAFNWGTDVKNNVQVTDGVFTVTIDFGDAYLSADFDFWMQISVREGANIGAYTPLTPLQKIRNAPYASKALRVPAFSISSGELAPNSVTTGSIADGSVQSIDIGDGTVSSLDIANNTIQSADIQNGTVTGNDLSSNLNLNGTLTWNCPANTVRVGNWCMETQYNNAADAGTSIADCHNKGMQLCPIESLMTCDQMNILKGDFKSCGSATDCGSSAGDISIRTSTLAVPSQSSSFGRMITYIGCAVGDYANNSTEIAGGAASWPYFCCKPVSH